MKLMGNVKSLLLVYNFKSKNDTSKTFLKKPTDYKYVRFTSFNTFGFETENIRYNNGSDVLDNRIRNYDSNGNRVLSSFYDSIGELTLKVVEKYDMNGNKINILGYGRNGKLYSKETIRYNKRDSIIERRLYNHKGINNYIDALKYDTNGNKVERLVYQMNSDNNLYLDSKYSFFYDDNILTQSIHSNDRMNIKTVKYYDLNGNFTELVSFDTDSIIKRRLVFKFDGQGNEVERLEYGYESKLIKRQVSKFDNRGNKIESIYYNSDGKLHQKFNSKYDENNNEIEITSVTPLYKNIDKDKLTWGYVYDNNNNWIKKIQYKNGIPEFITERIIEYYN